MSCTGENGLAVSHFAILKLFIIGDEFCNVGNATVRYWHVCDHCSYSPDFPPSPFSVGSQLWNVFVVIVL